MIKPYKITEKGKETPFLWNGKRMTFRNKGSAKHILIIISKDFPYLDLEIKECYNKSLKRMFDSCRK